MRPIGMTLKGLSKVNPGDIVSIFSADNKCSGAIGSVEVIDYAVHPEHNLITIKVLDVYMASAWEHEIEIILAS